MQLTQIPISLSPHLVNGKPRGYYVIAHRLFPNGQPVLFRQQFVGFSHYLIITVAHNGLWDSVVKMAVNLPILNARPVSWLSTVQQYGVGTGLQIYLPRKILKPPPAEAAKIETMGLFCKEGTDTYYLGIPKLDADIMLARKELR